jgi:hypothetical protein
MSRKKGKIALPTGVVGLSLTIAGIACAESNSAEAAVSPQARSLNLHEDEVIDTTMASFYVSDKENPGGVRAGEGTRLAGWRCWWRCRCRCRCRCGWRCGCA